MPASGTWSGIAGHGFSLPATHRSGWLTVGLTVATTLLVWAIGLSLWLGA